MPDADDRVLDLLARLLSADRDRVGERLATVSERRFDDGADVRQRPAARRPLEGDEGRLDPRSRAKDLGRDGVKADLARGELNQHGHGSIGLRPRLGEEPVGRLPLHHHAPALERGRMLERLDHERRRDVVRKVRHELRRRRLERVRIDGERVAEDQADVLVVTERLAERLLEGAVELDGVDEADLLRQIAGEDAETGTDLEDDVDFVERGQAPDDTQDVLVDEEVLAERLLRPDTHGRRNAAAAFACVREASSSVASPRAAASPATVCTT